MRRAAAACLLSWGALAAAPAAAQEPASAPPGPYAIDIRGSVSSLPPDARLAGVLPNGARTPGRALGVEAGVHVYPFSLGPARVGFGVTVIRAGGDTPEVIVETGSSVPPDPADTRPGVSTTLTALAPQVSFNFGTAQGWSYLSAGIGRARLQTTTSPFVQAVDEDASSNGNGDDEVTDEGGDAPAATARRIDTGGLTSINIGGGARWFTRSRLAFSFDVRFHRLPPGAVGGTPATMVVVSAGVSLR